ncbi:MAG TPA: hypothetical protein VF167_09025 [Longimicrobiaceae bacterium]
MNITIRNRALTGGALVAGLLLMAAAPAPAQQTAEGPRWQAWIGCWEPTADAAAPSDAPDVDRKLCVVPTAQSDAAEMVSIADGEVESRSTVRADGEQHRAEREGCTGWESASWSANGTRLYLRSQFNCEGGLERISSGVMAFAPDQEWIDVQAVSVGGNSGVQVVRYRPASNTADLPAEIRASLENRTLAADAARMAAAARIGPDDVIEASRNLDATALEAWLVERDQSFTVDARTLTRLADAGVPTRVIDLLVALAYPEVFAVDNSARQVPPRVGGPRGPVWDPWWGPGYGYYPYGRRYWGWYGGYPGVIIVRQPDGSRSNGGKAVKGEGYRRGDRGGAATQPTSRPSSEGSSARSGGSGGSSRGTRTAKPKD